MTARPSETDAGAPGPGVPDLLVGRCAIVTGGSRGQGAEEARALVGAGASVVVTDVRDEEGRAVVDELGARARYLHLDVRDEDRWPTVVEAAVESFGPVSILVNNAGLLRTDTLQDTTRAGFDDIMATNATGVFLGMRAVLPSMRAAGGGSMVNISSVGGLTGRRGAFAYVASKWAVRGMTKAAALEFGTYGIRVNSIFPGAIRTAMIVDDSFDESSFIERNRQRLPIRRLGTGADVASAVVFLASDWSSYVTGAELAVDGGWTII